MNEEKNYTQVIKKGIVKTILWTAVAAVLALALLISSLQIPYIQTKVAGKLTEIVSEKIQFPVEIGYVNIRWFDSILLEDVLIKDTESNAMIKVKELFIDFQLYALFDPSNIVVDRVVLDRAQVDLIKNTDFGLNISLFINNLREWLASDKPAEKKPVFSIQNVELLDSHFSIHDPSRDSISDGFDYYHFNLADIELSAKDFRVVADTLEFDLLSLATHDVKTGLTIHEMSTFFRLSQRAMQFQSLHIHANESHIRDSLVFNFDNTAALSYFADSVKFSAQLDSTIIYSKDLALFAPSLNQYDDYYRLSGNLSGMVKDLSIKDMRLNFGHNSLLQGDLSFDGLPNIQETFISGNLSDATVVPADVKKYVNADIYKQVEKLGSVNLTGRFVGFPNDFVANGAFYTEIGNVVSDINLKIDETSQKSHYSGRISTQNFDIGKIMGRPDLVQRINMQGNIVGSGFQLENAEFDLKATITKLGIKGYEYRNIDTDARMAKEFFQGQLSINDPNLRFEADASVDLRKDINKIMIQAQLDTALLKPLNLSKKEIIIETNLDVDITGLEIDDILGAASFTNTFFSYEGNALQVDSLDLLSLRKDGVRNFLLATDFAEIAATGDYEFTTLYKDVTRLIHEYKLNFENNDQKIRRYYASKKKTFPDKYDLSFEIDLIDINPLVQLFAPQLTVSKKTLLEGSFTGGYTAILALNGHIDTLNYNGIEIYNTQAEINTSKIADSTNVLAMAYVYSKNQNLRNITETQDLLLEGVWLNDHIDFRTNIMVEDEKNYASINGELTFLTNRTEIRFTKSDLFAIGKQWDVSPHNKITIANKEINFDNLKVFHGYQDITINGALSDSTDKKLTVEINNFDVGNLNPLLPYQLKGEINGYLDIQNFYSEVLLESEMAVNDFMIEQFLVGNLSGLSKWNNAEQRLDVDFQIDRLSKRIMTLEGFIQPQNEENQLNIVASFDQANMNIAEPFIKDVFSEIKGVASGKFNISGRLNYPILTGEGEIAGGGFKLNYLNTSYTFGGKLFFDTNEIGVRQLNLYDANRNLAVLNGGVFHDGFKNFIIDLRAQLNNFEVLNTAASNNQLYYGNAFVTGRLNILGAVNNLHFDARATTNKGTRIFIPIRNTTGVQQEAYINFVNFNDSTNALAIENDKNQVDLRGINLNFDIDITPDAYTEIIFDLQAGDIIRGRGDGKINLKIDTNGDFNMFGNYEFVEGGYNFTLYNIINKEFSIHKGSTINWYGDPYEGILDIKASYLQMASLAPLVNNTSEEVELTAELKRRYPVEVILDLDGPLMSPAIGFDINITNYPENAITMNGGPSLGNTVDLFLSRISLDKQERERQVFSLIILRQFSPENSFNTSGTFSSSVSELFSNQLSYWITQVDENLEIDVDLSGLDAEAFNTFQLRLSYSFFNGRLRVTRDGAFTDVENETNPMSVLGEWTVEYFLTKDGKFRAKVYNRTNYDWYDQNNPETRNTTFSGGLSLLHVTSFDNLKELFRDFRREKAEKSQSQSEQETDKEADEQDDKPALNATNPREEERLPATPNRTT